MEAGGEQCVHCSECPLFRGSTQTVLYLTSKSAVARFLIILADIRLIVPSHCAPQVCRCSNWPILPVCKGDYNHAHRTHPLHTHFDFSSFLSCRETRVNVRMFNTISAKSYDVG